MTITDSELTLAKHTAAKAARRWNGVDPDEITASLQLWLVENYRHVERYRTEPGGRNKLATALWRAANTACATEHRAVHHNADGTHYTLTQLKRALPLLWDRDTWTQTVTTEHPHSVPSATDEAITMLIDIDTAFHSLPKTDRDLLAWRYHDEDTYNEIGERTNSTPDAARMAVNRALDRLHRTLGGDGRYRKPA